MLITRGEVTEREWEAIKAEYVAGLGSYRQLATKHDVSLDSLEKRARREGWAAARRQAGGKVAAELPRVVAATALLEAAQLPTQHAQAWQVLSDQVAALLPMVTKPAELLSLVSAFEKITNGQRKALGLDEKREGSQADDDLDEALRIADEREVCVDGEGRRS